MKKNKIALVRGKFLNKFEMQSFEPLVSRYDITAFSSQSPFHDKYSFPVIKLPSPIDLPDFPQKMPILNRVFVDAHYLIGLEDKLSGFDIVHSAETYFHYTRQSLLAKKRGKVKKVIATVWENIPFNNEGIWGRVKIKQNALRELDHIIAVTKEAKKVLVLEGAREDKISVISPGVDTKLFKPGQKLNKKDINVLFVGRLEEQKGVFEILYAAKKILSDSQLKDYKIKFSFVGEGSEKEKIINLEKKLRMDKFFIHKSLKYEKILNEYERADIFIAPSKTTKTWKEQYGMALVEAQACGLPIITTRSGGIEENVASAGIYIPEGNFLELYVNLRRLITDPALRLKYSNRARERAVSVHDIRITSARMDSLYKSLLEI